MSHENLKYPIPITTRLRWRLADLLVKLAIMLDYSWDYRLYVQPEDLVPSKEDDLVDVLGMYEQADKWYEDGYPENDPTRAGPVDPAWPEQTRREYNTAIANGLITSARRIARRGDAEARDNDKCDCVGREYGGHSDGCKYKEARGFA